MLFPVHLPHVFDYFDFGLFDVLHHYLRESAQTVLVGHFRGVHEPGHVHGVSSEALDVDPMIEEDVPIIAIVMETLQVCGVLQVLLELHDNT